MLHARSSRLGLAFGIAMLESRIEASPRAPGKEPPGLRRGAVPPRRSRGGDDRRIAPTQGQYVARYTLSLEQRFSLCSDFRVAIAIDRASALRHSFSMPKPELLETFPNPYPGRDYEIAMECPEFTRSVRSAASRATRTSSRAQGRRAGLRHDHITYVPGDVCIELKSLKLYLWSFRNDGIFYERAVNRILDDVARVTKPRWMEVVGDFNIRGGIKSVIRARVGARSAG